MPPTKTKTKGGSIEARRIAARIVARRDELGLTNADLARLMEVGPPRIHNWTSGSHEPRLGTVKKLAKALRCEVTFLLGLP